MTIQSEEFIIYQTGQLFIALKGRVKCKIILCTEIVQCYGKWPLGFVLGKVGIVQGRLFLQIIEKLYCGQSELEVWLQKVAGALMWSRFFVVEDTFSRTRHVEQGKSAGLCV